jgi:hypothetical protein
MKMLAWEDFWVRKWGLGMEVEHGGGWEADWEDSGWKGFFPRLEWNETWFAWQSRWGCKLDYKASGLQWIIISMSAFLVVSQQISNHHPSPQMRHLFPSHLFSIYHLTTPCIHLKPETKTRPLTPHYYSFNKSLINYLTSRLRQHCGFGSFLVGWDVIICCKGDGKQVLWAFEVFCTRLKPWMEAWD